MRLIHVARTFRPPQPYDAEELAPIVQHIARNAAESTPYSTLNILDEILKVGPPFGIEGSAALTALAGVIQELITNHKWYTVSGFVFAAYGPVDTMLRSVLYGAAPAGVSMNVQSLAETVQACTGDYPDADTLRKNLQRLANNGKFLRLDKGVYVREVRGI